MAKLGSVHKSRDVQRRQRLREEVHQIANDSQAFEARKAFDAQVNGILDELQHNLEYLREQGLRYALAARLGGPREPYSSLQYLRNATEDIRKILVQYHGAVPPVMEKL